MHRFQPTRASPQTRKLKPSPSTCTDLSQSVNGTVAPELQNLSPADIDVLDAVIKRAGPGAATFFTIFKAYSDVLKERGLDPQEVVYYGKLLKLGTLKGKDWGEKWSAVKSHNVYSALDAHTIGSFQSESDFPLNTLSDGGQHSPSCRPQRPAEPTIPQRSQEKTFSSKLNAPIFTLNSAPNQMKFQLDPKEFPILASIAQKANARVSQNFQLRDERENISPFPPSYKSAALDETLPTLPLHLGVKQGQIISSIDAALISHRQTRVIDLDDAFKNIKLEQDEKFADKFREDMLIARCWEMWRKSFLWIITTHQQIGEARDKLLLRLFIQRWQTHLANCRTREDELVRQFDVHRLGLVFGVWQAKLRQRRQIAWRNDMRQKMKIIKIKSDTRIQKEAWDQWRQVQLAYQADNHYRLVLLSRYHTQWKRKFNELDDLDVIAEQLFASIRRRAVEKFLFQWKRATNMRHDELVMSQRVDCRIMVNALDLWRERMAYLKTADAFRNKAIKKYALQTWKRSMNRLHALDNRVTNHLARQDGFLFRAVVRIWRARMRGKRLEQFKASLVVRGAWQTWKVRISSFEADFELADNFSKHVDTRIAADTLVRWQQILTTHRNAHQYAVKYHDAQLCSKILLLWRLRLRDNAQSAKVARWANRFFDTRRAWRAWAAALEARRREERLKLWNKSVAYKMLSKWRLRTREEQYFKQCEFIIRDRVEKRIMSSTLAQWTNRVIEVKSRELDTALRSDRSLLRHALQKWKICQRQHFEEVSLLENYLLVKREDVLRRAFHHWLNAKRLVEHRRLTHQRKEEHLRQQAITSAWEKWRERFKEVTLRPLEYQILLESQKNLLRRAFTVWLSKTDSLPAVKFHSKHIKEKFFNTWRNMMPTALRAKKARETDRFNTLAKSFETWLQIYKTKTTLKAVARAKYLQLPAASSRQTITRSRPLYTGASSNLTSRPSRFTQEEAEDSPLPDPSKPPYIPRTGLTRPRLDRSATRSEYSTRQRSPEPPRRAYVARTEFTKPKTRSERSVPRSEYSVSAARQSSPVRSIASMPDRRPKSPYSRTTAALLPQLKVGSDGGTLWSAIKDLGQTRRPRNL